MAEKIIFQLKVTLKDIRPLIWRRIQIADPITLAQLHLILQEVMGWANSHLYQFTIGGINYGIPDDEWGLKIEDAKKVKLADMVAEEKSKFVYEYDFGDGWEHEILVEKVLPPEKGQRYPVCLAGKRACPPEDCGGAWGYANLLEIIRNPRHKEYKEMMEWLGEGFEPEAFDVDEVNMVLMRKRK